ncbi:MAG: polysaccharide biosynthesis tyrosine autokinase [Clostridia bacterium]|nr:polysaccharide biosynthesis tyrosine autokinase [Clostridia bacterium]
MKELSIKDIIAVLYKKIVIILLVTVLSAVAAIVYTKFFVTPVYTTSAYFAISNLDEESSNVANPTTSTIQASQLLTKAISSALLVEGSDIYTLVSNELNLENGVIPGKISISADDTFVLRISVTALSPETAREIAMAFRNCIPEYLKNHNMGSAAPLNTPKLPGENTGGMSRNAILGALLGAVVTCGIVLLLALLDNTVKDEESVAANTNIPVLSEIPSLNVKSKKEIFISKIPYLRKKFNKELKTAKTTDILSSSTSFSIVESYKQLRTNLQFSVSVNKNNIIAVSSSIPGEGKSTTSCNLAISLAEDNKKILLIDCDLRKPTIHKKLKLDNRCGVSGLLSKQYGVDEAVKKDVYKNLDVITSGSIPPNPSELLGSDAFAEYLNEFSKAYDYIIIDSPPIALVTDVRSFANKTAGVLLVAKQNFTLYGDIVRSANLLEQSNSSILGIVITDVDIRENRSYSNYRYGGYHYKYASSGDSQNNSMQNKVDLTDDD